jgi:hypothetical protein
MLPSREGRRHLIKLAATAALLCSWVPLPAQAQQPTFGGTDISFTKYYFLVGLGIGVIAGGGIYLGVHQTHHNLKGCVSTGPSGLLVQGGGSRPFLLQGDTTTIKSGNVIKVHGSRVKKVKGATGDPVFLVEKVNKVYGPCPASTGGTR